MQTILSSIVRLDGHPGQLRRVADATGPAVDTLIWEGEVDGLALASLLALSMRHAMVPCEIEGRPHRARAQGCWFDAGRGALVVELAGMPEPLD